LFRKYATLLLLLLLLLQILLFYRDFTECNENSTDTVWDLLDICAVCRA